VIHAPIGESYRGGRWTGGLSLASADADARTRALDEAELALYIARRIPAAVFVVHLGLPRWQRSEPGDARDGARRSVEALAALAAPLGLNIYLEPMPWTDVRDFTQAAHLVDRAGQPNSGVLIDPIHFDRAGNHAGQIAAVPAARLAYLQFCDAPAERPADLAGLLHQARAERLPPGEGGLDLRGILAATPADAPLSLEIPMRSRGLPAHERALTALQATQRFIARTP